MADPPAPALDSEAPTSASGSPTTTEIARPASPTPLLAPVAATTTNARATGRSRSKSFYGKENSVPTPQKPGGIERKNTALDLQSIVLRATLKENISNEIAAMKENGTYEYLEDPGDLSTFEQQAVEVLEKKADEIKQMRTTDEGKALLRRTLLLQRYFERKEDNKDCFAEGEFHAKCLVDDLLFNFLVDPPGNTRG